MGAHAAEPVLVDRVTTVSELFEPAEAATLARTLPADQPIHFRVRLPGGEHPGVLMFVRADDSGELPAEKKTSSTASSPALRMISQRVTRAD